jgi:hypothetical protein
MSKSTVDVPEESSKCGIRKKSGKDMFFKERMRSEYQEG